MDGLRKLKTPGLVASCALHGIGIYMMLSAVGLEGSAKSRNFTVERQLQGSDYLLDPKIREREIQCGQGMTVYLWSALGCWILSLGGLAPSILNLTQKRFERFPGPTEDKETLAAMPVIDPVTHGICRNLKKGLDELEDCLKKQPMQFGEGVFLHAQRENLKVLESQSKQAYNAIMGSHESVQKTTVRVEKLAHQCRESANFAATNRMDLKKTNMINVLSQMRQNQDRVVDTSKNIASLHASTLRLLSESLHGETIFYHKIARVQEHLEDVQGQAHIGNKAHDGVMAIIGESRDEVHNAAKIVNTLNQKSDNLLSIVRQVDDVAEKINSQALQASLELSRSTGGGVSDVFSIGTELRGLAARFHTYARHLHDVSSNIQAEIERAQLHLGQAGEKAEEAFITVGQCGEFYRNSVSAGKYSLSELGLLQKEVGIHMKKLGETAELGGGAQKLMSDLEKHLSGHSEMNKKIQDETNHMAVYCDKISTLLSKQYYELVHCEKMLAEGGTWLSEAMRHATEYKHSVSSLKAGLDQVQVQGERPASQSAHENDVAFVTKLEDFKALLNRLEASIDAPGGVHSAMPSKPPMVPVMSVKHG